MDTNTKEEYDRVKEELVYNWTNTLFLFFGGPAFHKLNTQAKLDKTEQVARMIVGDIEYMGKILAESEPEK